MSARNTAGRSWLGGAPLGKEREKGEGSTRVSWGKEGRGNWGRGAEGVRKERETRGARRKRRGALREEEEKEGATLGTRGELTQVQFDPTPISLPQMRTHRQNRGEKPNAHLLSSRYRHRVCRGTDLWRGDKEMRGAVHRDSGGLGGTPGLQELEARVPGSEMQTGSLGGRRCQGLGRGSRV